MFAKRKRNLFKGPMLNMSGGPSGNSSHHSRGSGSGSHSRSASASGLGRRSGEITIQEVDEDDEQLHRSDLEEVEEVDMFSPVIRGPGEQIEEHIFDEGEAVPDVLGGAGLAPAPTITGLAAPKQ